MFVFFVNIITFQSYLFDLRACLMIEIKVELNVVLWVYTVL